MKKKKIVVTGSGGLIGSEVVSYFSSRGYEIHGFDSNQRSVFFGPSGDISWNIKRLTRLHADYKHYSTDIRDRAGILAQIDLIRPTAIIHAAAQPSHDLAARIPFDDFETNAVGTLNLLEAARRFCPESPFVYLSTNKVYGDKPNELNLIELESRWDYEGAYASSGISENFPIDQSKHSLFGASKLAADIMVQEYGRYFGMPTTCLRGGCLTGPAHNGVELHGFLSYLVKCNLQSKVYKIYGYKGKQVRDNIHSFDVASFISHFIEAPRIAEVYNIGGGKENCISIIEAFALIESISGRPMISEYINDAREGDHIVYYSDLRKARAHYTEWTITRDLNSIFREIYERWSNIHSD